MPPAPMRARQSGTESPMRITTSLPAALCALLAGLPTSAGSPPAHDDHAPAKHTAPKPEAAKPETPARAADDHADPHEAPARQATRQPAQPARDAEPASESEESTPGADRALELLREGNARWVKNSASAPNTSPDRRASTAEQGQKPFASILTCADSRLPVERLFDRGVGELFVVRVAGNIAGASEVGTIEYGVGHLNTPLLVVMGHTRCGAVAAAVSNAKVHGAVKGLIDSIEPAVERARKSNPGADEKTLTAAAINENVWQTIYELVESSPDIRSRLRAGKLRVVGAVCDVGTGRVQWLGDHPWQAELLDAVEARTSRQTKARPSEADQD